MIHWTVATFLATTAAAHELDDPPPSPTVESSTVATEDAPTDGDPAPPPPPDARPDPPALVHDAALRIEQADYLGARILLNEALETTGPHTEEATYLTGVAWELGGQVETAIDTYREVMATWPDGARHDDAEFRLAEATATLGDLPGAIARMEALSTTTDADALKVGLLLATWRMELEPSKRTERDLRLVLATAAEGVATFYQAKAHIALATRRVAEAAELTFDVRDRKQARRLDKRGVLILTAEDHVTTAARLEEPEWILEGLLQLGSAYEALGADLLAAKPKRLSETQRAEYDAIIEEKVDFIWVKAQRHYARGIEMGQRLRWRSDRLDELEASKTAIEARLESL